MTEAEFRRMVEAMVAEIPQDFLEGLQGVHVLPQSKLDPEGNGLYWLGEYLDPGAPDTLSPGEGLGRHLALYYGSFAALAEGEQDFDWEGEAWETLLHEVRHHVESRAGQVDLVEEDFWYLDQIKDR